MRVIAVIALGVACLALGWSIAEARAATPILRVMRIANHLPRDGSLHRGRIHACSSQARVWRDGHGYAGVSCHGASLVVFRDTRGRWGKT